MTFAKPATTLTESHQKYRLLHQNEPIHRQHRSLFSSRLTSLLLLGLVVLALALSASNTALQDPRRLASFASVGKAASRYDRNALPPMASRGKINRLPPWNKLSNTMIQPRSTAAHAAGTVAAPGVEDIAPGVPMFAQPVFFGSDEVMQVRPQSHTKLLAHYTMQRRKIYQDFSSSDSDMHYWVTPKTYWAQVWPAALVLAQHVIENGDGMSGKSCVELGCGMGLPGVCAAVKGASAVLMTDGEELAVKAAQLAADVNGVGERATADTLDWRRGVGEKTYDVVMASEALYDEANTTPFARTVGKLVAPGGRVLIGNRELPPARPYLEDFLRIAQEEEGLKLVSHERKTLKIDDDGWATVDGVKACEFGFPGDASEKEGTAFSMSSVDTVLVDMIVLEKPAA